ncbi:MAG: hypothetical protein WA865_22290 [Spirulinaceae cyanobacterium]
MTSSEADGIKIKIIEPNLIVRPIRENRKEVKTCLQIHVTISNNLPKLFPFVYDLLTPELLTPQGQILHPQKLINRQTIPHQYYGMGIPHQATLRCYLIAEVSWHNNLLKLQGYISNPNSLFRIAPYYCCSFEALQLGAYQLKFTYSSPKEEFLFFDARTREEASKVQTSVTNLLFTSWVNLQLVEPVESNQNAVEYD